jgi:hypothetical protein
MHGGLVKSLPLPLHFRQKSILCPSITSQVPAGSTIVPLHASHGVVAEQFTVMSGFVLDVVIAFSAVVNPDIHCCIL